MCGICGIVDLKGKKRIEASIIERMRSKLLHRGPDGVSHYYNGNLAFGFTRLSIIDLEGGMQPLFNEDSSLLLFCNGEIFNYIELRRELIAQGHRFKTNTDVEVILHLYEESRDYAAMLNRLNGQFSFALFDRRRRHLFCARDHFGITPFFYTTVDDFFIFASEIKAILEHPQVEREVDLVGLDQIFSFPGLIAPRTMFKQIRSLENGHYLLVEEAGPVKDAEYWDVIYPQSGEIHYSDDEDFYAGKLAELIARSVKLRLRADVPVGLYLSGGLDSAIVSAQTRDLTPETRRYSFSIDFEEKDKSEAKYQQIMADFIQSVHSRQLFRCADIVRRLEKAVYHSECPLKETYNTASLALSEAARRGNIKVVLSGEGADEWFAGYAGYQFDQMRQGQPKPHNRETSAGSELNRRLWGDASFTFEMNQAALRETKKNLYSPPLREDFAAIDALEHKVVDIQRLQQRDILHKRSYLDYKLRLVSHLIADHGDRMAYANSVEGRYPFLDRELVEFVATIPPSFKLKDLEEKYILKKASGNQIPREILDREKFAFHAPGSPYLLKKGKAYIHDLLSHDTIKRQGYFDPAAVDALKSRYSTSDFLLNIPYETDLLIIVITFGIFLEVFNLPNL